MSDKYDELARELFAHLPDGPVMTVAREGSIVAIASVIRKAVADEREQIALGYEKQAKQLEEQARAFACVMEEKMAERARRMANEFWCHATNVRARGAQ